MDESFRPSVSGSEQLRIIAKALRHTSREAAAIYARLKDETIVRASVERATTAMLKAANGNGGR